MSLANGFSILCMFSRNQVLVLLIFGIVSFISFSFVSALIFMIFILLLTLANRWETVDTVADFIFLGSRITADGYCSHEFKRCLLLRRKVMTNLDSTLKSRDITLSTKVHLVQAMVFPMVMYGCESWTIKKDECRRIDAFELWCWRRLLGAPWTARRSNQSNRNQS